MADALVTEVEDTPRGPTPVRRLLRWLGYAVLGLAAALLLFVAFLHTGPGRQFIVDQIAKVSPASGLSVDVGSIEGSVLWSATFNDVELRDANDALFLEVPRVELNWRPWKWFFSGLDVRHLVLSDGTLHSAPELIPGDPDAPILPDFDIRVDRFVIEDLTVAEGLLGAERVIQFRTQADVSDGRVFLDADGEFGGGDELALLVEAEPDGDIFDLDLTWRAPAGGFLAAMAGAEEDLLVRLEGDGNWTSWQGELLALQGGKDLLDFDLYNEAGQYRLVGTAYPSDYLSGVSARALGTDVAFTASGTLQDSTLQGSWALRGQGIDVDGSGGVNLAANQFEQMQVDTVLLDPTLFGSGVELQETTLSAMLDGPFQGLQVPHELRIGRIVAGQIIFAQINQAGTIDFAENGVNVPLNASVARVTSGVELFDPRLVDGKIVGSVNYSGNRLTSDNLAISFPGLDAQLAMRGDLDNGKFRFIGPADVDDLAFADVGLVDVQSQIDFAIGGGAPWSLNAGVQGSVDQLTNPTIETLAGENITFAGALSVSETQALRFAGMEISASKLEALADGRLEGDETLITLSGTHGDYGTFAGDARLTPAGPYADLLFDRPLDAADLSNVRLVLAPSDNGFAIETSGDSILGPFDGLIDLLLAEEAETRLAVRRLDVMETRVTGDLRMVEGGLAGRLDLSRGGVNGIIGLAARPSGQAFDIELTARNARFGGGDPLILARADMDMSGFIAGDQTTLQGQMTAEGITWGTLFLGRMAADAQLEGGEGTFNAALAGRRGSRFELRVNGQANADRIAVAVGGSYAGQSITMPQRAVLARLPDGGWNLQRMQLGYGDGYAIARGRFGGDEAPQGRLSLSEMPLSLTDAYAEGLGLGGTISGVIEIAASDDGKPTGEARIMVDDLTRSGLMLTSRPMDLAGVVQLSPDALQARAVMEDGSGVQGRLDARIAGLPDEGTLVQRLYAGDLFGQLRYNGPAEALWRLAALDLLDVSGPLEVAASVRGSLGDPQVRGSMEGDGLHVQSALTGSDISDVSLRGRFNGSRLQLSSFSGNAPNGGRVSGSGSIDLANMTRDRGPQIDLRIAARDARILQLPGMGATVTGPLRIVSNGVGGTIAGRLQVNAAEWRLGTADEIVELPDIAITEVNLPVDIAPPRRAARPWRYLMDITARRGIKVDGMGLDSEWSGDLRLRGTTADPRIGGDVNIVPRQGFYSFAGVRFDITRGHIAFDEGAPPDPRLDLLAETEVNGLDVDVTVGGLASQPEIAFSSVPALPEEELLARMLFGGSITELSATDAVQLGAALASLRGGSGIDPINQLRTAIGLDRLRIIAADPALDRGASVALGKNITRRLYAELVTDGQGYNATELEYRVTNWLSLLGSISTLGRGSAAVEISRDY